ncbi:MAG: serine/threonine protein kinase [Deltaproteobacteria bacterium]|nr:serine/threonine protein kinase [Deltaproteobacteria bacterium]
MAKTVRFGSYELLSLLGKGGMARVFRAARSGPHGFSKEVALKVLDPNATATPDQIAALTDEARLGGLLRHQNIVTTDELGQVGPFYYIAMELVDGWPLDWLLRAHSERRVPVPRSVVLDVLMELCAGLAYAHELAGPDGRHLGVVHRDMKPGNIMISQRGEVKIMDFGIAKAITNVYVTQEQTARGTPLFMSPEQVMGERVDARSDLFALGGILHELVTLEPTFAGEEVVPVLRAVMDVDIGPATERIRAEWPEILPLFLRLMQERPDDRYPGASALQDDLRALKARLPAGIDLPRWVKQVAPALPVAQTGELGDVLPRGAELSLDSITSFDDFETISLPQAAVSAFEMPLGPTAGPARGAPTPSTPVQRQMVHSAPNLAAVPSPHVPAQLDYGVMREPEEQPREWLDRANRGGRSATRSMPPRRPAPSPGHPRVPPRRPAPRTPHVPTTWQKRAARKALITRLLGLAGTGLFLLFAGTLLPGPWGDRAREWWSALTGWIAPMLGQ